VVPKVVPYPEMLADVVKGIGTSRDNNIYVPPPDELDDTLLHPSWDHRPREPEEDGTLLITDHP